MWHVTLMNSLRVSLLYVFWVLKLLEGGKRNLIKKTFFRLIPWALYNLEEHFDIKVIIIYACTGRCNSVLQ